MHRADVGGGAQHRGRALLVDCPQTNGGVIRAGDETHGIGSREIYRPNSTGVFLKLGDFGRGSRGGVPQLDEAVVVRGDEVGADVRVPRDGREF